MNFTYNDLEGLKYTQVLTQNDKMKKTSKAEKIRLYNFGISAYKSHSTGKVTCPFAKDCIKFCYARKGSFIWSNTKKAYEKRYLLTKEPELFKSKITDAIKRRKATHIRIHDSGDFYNRNYILQWFEIMRNFENVTFYAYTKSKMLFDEFDFLPSNFTIIYSLGSRFDNLIDTSIDRHSKIFYSMEEMQKQGYIDASNNDLIAIDQTTNKIGLLIH
jgi:hypothetical protein